MESWDPSESGRCDFSPTQRKAQTQTGPSRQEPGRGRYGGLPHPKPLQRNPTRPQQTVCVRVCACVCVCVGQATDAASLCAGARGSGHIPFPREAFQGAKLHHLPRRRSAAAALRSRPQRRNKSAAQSRGQRASSPLNPASVQPLLAPRSPPLSQLLAPSSKCCSYKQLTQILGLN